MNPRGYAPSPGREPIEGPTIQLYREPEREAGGPTRVSLQVFGCVEISGTGRGMTSLASQSKRVALFTYLTLADPRGFHRRDALLPLFWPELDQRRARAALRQSIYYLRRNLGPDVITNEGDETIGVIRDLVDCDALAFDEAIARGDRASALELYLGDPLAGFHVPDVDPDLEEWMRRTRERYRERAASAARELARSCLDANPDRAQEWARRAMTIDPHDEVALRMRMKGLRMAGDPIRAMSVYETFARRLQAEYDVEPGPESQELFRSIREFAGVEAGGTGKAAPDSADSDGEGPLYITLDPGEGEEAEIPLAERPHLVLEASRDRRTIQISLEGKVGALRVSLHLPATGSIKGVESLRCSEWACSIP